MIHHAVKAGLPIPVFTLDTQLLFPETLELQKRLEDFFGIEIESLFPELTLEDQASEYGSELWKKAPDVCCTLRKVVPLQKKLETLSVWITGLRRQQSDTREKTGILELYHFDVLRDHYILKMNPMATWSREAVWDYIRQNKIPYNPLQDRGYPLHRLPALHAHHAARGRMSAPDAGRASRRPNAASTLSSGKAYELRHHPLAHSTGNPASSIRSSSPATPCISHESSCHAAKIRIESPPPWRPIPPTRSSIPRRPRMSRPRFFLRKSSRGEDAHLDSLESQSIFLIREAYHYFKNICMPWSMGKDSNVLIWLSKKAFGGHIPYPLLHIDTTYEFPEMLEYRDWAVKHHDLNLIVKINEDARAGRGEYASDRADRLRDDRSRDRDARAKNRRAAAGHGRAQMGRADYRHPPR